MNLNFTGKAFFRFEFLKIYIHYLRRRCENRTPFADHAPFANYFLHETISTPSFCKWCKRELRWITRISLSLYFYFRPIFSPRKIVFQEFILPKFHRSFGVQNRFPLNQMLSLFEFERWYFWRHGLPHIILGFRAFFWLFYSWYRFTSFLKEFTQENSKNFEEKFFRFCFFSDWCNSKIIQRRSLNVKIYWFFPSNLYHIFSTFDR